MAGTLTFYFGDGTQKDVLLSLLVFDARQHFFNDALGELHLLALLHLLLVPHPAVQDRLDLCSNDNLLLLDKGL